MSKIKSDQLKQLVEAAIFVSEKAISDDQILQTVLQRFNVNKTTLKAVIDELILDYAPRGIHLTKVASGYRFQSDNSLGELLSHLWHENAPKYSRAMLEILALIAYKQPITRGEIEEVRGVAVSSHIIKTLSERGWIKVIGHKEVPGRPALFATTKVFLDYFCLASLAELPSADVFEEHLALATQAAETEAAELDLEERSRSIANTEESSENLSTMPLNNDNGQIH